MQIFNIGVLELLFILIIAFVVLGPQKAVKTAGDVGRWIRDLAKSPIWRDIMATSRDIRNLPKTMMDDIDLEDTLKELDRSTQEINRTLSQVQAETEAELAKIEGEIDRELQMPPVKLDVVPLEGEENTEV